MNQLSTNFSLEELLFSSTGERLGLDNTPDATAIGNLQDLVDNVLQPLRDKLGLPLHVDSAFRSPAVNSAVGGASNSQHLLGQAADLICPQMDHIMLANFIDNNDLPYDQLILEFTWVHVSYSPLNRKQKLTAKMVDGRIAYLQGFV